MSVLKGGNQGFTIVELLIVVVVIAILAAITIVSYQGITSRATTSAMQHDLSEAAQFFETYNVQNGSYPSTLAAAESASPPLKLAASNSQLSYSLDTSSNPAVWSLTEISADGSKSYHISQNAPNSAQGITNLFCDPRATTYSGHCQESWTNGRWFGNGISGTYSLVTGAADGPVGISTYARKLWGGTVSSGGGNGDTGFDVSGGTQIQVTPGEVLTISGYLRPSSAGKHGAISIYNRDASGNTISRSYGADTVLPAGTWTRESTTYTVPSGIAQLAISIDINGNSTVGWATGDTLDGTGLMMTLGPTLYNFADGDSASGWAWNGAAHLSTSSGPAL